MKALSVTRSAQKVFVACAMAALLAIVGCFALAPEKGQALTAGQIETAQPISYVLGQPWSPSWLKCYSVANGKAVLKTKYDQDSDMHQFQAALNPSFTKGVKWLSSVNDNVSSYGLKPGKTYYIRFRNYGDTINGYTYDNYGYAYGPWVSNWSAVKAVKICKSPKKKNKVVGKWKLVKANFNSATVKYNNKHGGKFLLTLKKNGKGVMKDYRGTKYAIPSWGITSKKAGVVALTGAPANMQEYGTVRVSGKRLVLKMKSDGGKTYKMTFKRR